MFDEKEILEFWEKNKIFEKSVSARKDKKPFVFFEGPPTANGVPGIHHTEVRVFKDAVLRYKTMRGYYVPRRAGWDTHGLPVEVEVEKALGLKSKKDIEKYGVAAFNKKCRESVWKYKELWEDFTKRMGFWIDMACPYITYENSYIESLWWIIKEFAKKKLLYEDYKVVPWCARCGTALSSHELAQGYEKIKEESVYVKVKLKERDFISLGGGGVPTYFLVWTTTPWTLPGNVALAVNPKIGYVMLEVGDEKLVLAESRMDALGKDYKILKKFKGSELIGLQYESLYPDKAPYKVVGGDFVSAKDGTGVVHIAPAFGDDDFRLSKKHDLPILMTTTEQGLMQTPGKLWDGVWFKKADHTITDDLKSRGLLFRTELYEHDYPFCWRCKNPLMYLARKAWWIDVNAVRPKLLENNEKINWLPEHIKHGRFGEWLRETKNWAFSRERYWGTPLPVWRCEKCSKWEAVGSIDELKKRKKNSGNRYFIARHGEAETNVKNITNCDLSKNHYHLTPKGKKEVEAFAQNLLNRKIKLDVIFASPFLRTKETAEIIASILKVPADAIKIDPRLGEINTGIFAEGNPAKYHSYFKDRLEKFTKTPPEGENLTQLKKRMFDSVSEIESRCNNKTILIVSHEYPLWMLWAAVGGKTNEESAEEKEGRDDFLKTAEFEELNFHQLPRDENLVLDLHKPYVDEVKLKCSCGGEMQRVSEVVDVWFDSGAMPFASAHYPFSMKHEALNYPADYISEAIDQTRGWFYSLLAVSTLLGKGISYKNVIATGLILDSKGKKMSKSLGNAVDPMAVMEKYGADAARWYFLTVNQPWDSKLFKEEDVKDAQRRFFMILWNVLQFWKMYGSGRPGRNLAAGPPSVIINRWVLAKLAETENSLTKKFDSYDIVGAARELENFVVEDISRWYIRRIRDVMKESSKDAQETNAVLAHLLGEVAKLLAPFAPFTAEKIWLELGHKNSVHLEDWPTPRGKTLGVKSTKTPSVEERGDIPGFFPRGGILKDMDEVRKIVGLALDARAKAGIKVRQPLALLKIRSTKHEIRNNVELLNLIKEEINVKKIEFDAKLKDEILLDAAIIPELKKEGILRDLIREIQAARKTAGLRPQDKVEATLQLPKEIFEVAKKYEKDLMKETNSKSIKLSKSAKVSIALEK